VSSCMSDCLYSVCLFAYVSLSDIVHFSSSWPPERGRVLPGARCVLLQLVVPTSPIPFTPCAQHCRTRCQCQCSCTVIRHSPPRYRSTPRGPRGNRFMSGVHFMLRNYDPRKSASAMFSQTFVRCQSADPIIPADLHPQADATASPVRTPLLCTE